MASNRQRFPEYGTARYKQARARLLAGGPMCHWCNVRPATTADHEPPLEQVGCWHWEMVPACAPCNYGRRGKSPDVVTPSREW